jgi:MFS family permease
VLGPLGGPLGVLARTRTFEALRFREYRLLWIGQLGASLGQQMDQVTRSWLIYDLTGSALQLGLINLMRLFPILLLGPLAGTAADRYGRKTQLIADQATNATVNFILAALVITGHVQPWHVYVTGFIVALLQVFQQPARQAMVPEAVDRVHLTNAIGLNSVAFNGSRAIGPAIAGAIVAVVGPGGSYIVQGVIYVLTSHWTRQLRLPNRPPARALGVNAAPSSVLASTLEGWRYVRRDPVIRAGIVVSYVPQLLAFPFATLLPIFARDVLGTGADGQGLLLAAMGLGAVGSAVLIASFGDRLPKGYLMVGALAVYALALLAFSRSIWFPLSLALMIAIGICNVYSGALVQTVVQAKAPPELRGRIIGVFQQGQVMFQLGGFLTGWTASLLGAQETVALMGATLLVSAAGIFIGIPTVRRIK